MADGLVEQMHAICLSHHGPEFACWHQSTPLGGGLRPGGSVRARPVGVPQHKESQALVAASQAQQAPHLRRIANALVPAAVCMCIRAGQGGREHVSGWWRACDLLLPNRRTTKPRCPVPCWLMHDKHKPR